MPTSARLSLRHHTPASASCAPPPERHGWCSAIAVGPAGPCGPRLRRRRLWRVACAPLPLPPLAGPSAPAGRTSPSP
eukprot:6255909-Alexandrium_andersonii.AAC.1